MPGLCEAVLLSHKSQKWGLSVSYRAWALYGREYISVGGLLYYALVFSINSCSQLPPRFLSFQLAKAISKHSYVIHLHLRT